MIKGHDIVEHTQTVSFSRFKESVTPTFPVLFKPEQEFLFMAPVGDVRDESRYVLPMRSRHK